MSDFIANLCSQLAAKQPISVIGGNTKAFLGGRLIDEPTSMCEHSGILSYEPTELVLTAKSGTTLAEIEHCLHAALQLADHGGACDSAHCTVMRGANLQYRPRSAPAVGRPPRFIS